MGLVSTILYFTVLSNWFWFIAIAISLYWFYIRKTIGFYDTSMDRADDRTFIVTGAESGIGVATVDLLAARGGRVIMACKDVTLGEAAKEKIIKRTLNQNLEVVYLDMESLESVRKFSAEIHKSEDKLNALINNPPTTYSSATTTADGLNTIMQVNYFGPYLLTNLLLDLIKKTPSSRIVFVTSVLHHFHKFSLDNINCDQENLPCCRIYFNSKLATILVARYLAKALQWTGITVNTVHPGMLHPDPTTEKGPTSLLGLLINVWRRIFGKTAQEGSMTSVYAASELKLNYVTGQHFSDCKISRCVAHIANDRILQEKVYERSSELVHLKLEERQI